MMESLGEILRRQVAKTSISGESTDTSFDAEPPSDDYLCPACRGAGFVYADVPLGHPDYGKAVPCRCLAQEQEKRRSSKLQRYSNIGALSGLTFDNIAPDGKDSDKENRDRFRRAYDACRAFASQPHGWLLLVGPSGSGKTHLAAAIVNYRLQQGSPAFFITVPDLMDHLRAAFDPSGGIPYDELFDRVRNSHLLVLDDLGMQSGTPWVQEKLEQLLTYRFHSRLPTVITTDMAIEDHGERVAARLGDASLCQTHIVREKTISVREYDGAGLSAIPLLRAMTFESFDLKRSNLSSEQHQNLEHAYRQARAFAQSPQGWLVLQGGQGCGKTHLAAAIANHQTHIGKPVLFVIVPDFLDHLRSTFSPDSKVSYDVLFEKVRKAPLLILDDFSYASVTTWAQEKLYQVISHRYNAKLPTVITTSLSLEEIDGRIASRMADVRLSTIFNIVAPDYRSDLSPTPQKRGQASRARRALSP